MTLACKCDCSKLTLSRSNYSCVRVLYSLSFSLEGLSAARHICVDRILLTHDLLRMWKIQANSNASRGQHRHHERVRRARPLPGVVLGSQRMMLEVLDSRTWQLFPDVSSSCHYACGLIPTPVHVRTTSVGNETLMADSTGLFHDIRSIFDCSDVLASWKSSSVPATGRISSLAVLCVRPGL